MDSMSKSPSTKSVSEQESARLYLGELVRLAEDLGHRNSELRNDGREILDTLLIRLEKLCACEDASSIPGVKEDQRIFAATRRELLASWLRVDSLIDNLLSSAADELFQSLLRQSHG